MKRILYFIGHSWGRVAAALGILLASIDGFDIAAIKSPLEQLIGQKWVAGITALLFILSFIRHQQAADKLKELQARLDQK